MSNALGRYLYCIAKDGKPGVFQSRGVDNQASPVKTLAYHDICAVLSDFPLDLIRATPGNCARHEEVLREATQRYCVLLPFEFGMVAPNEQAVMSMLKINYMAIRNALKKIAGKTEVCVKALWRDMKAVFSELLSEHKMIARYKQEIAQKPYEQTHTERIQIGQMVSEALREKKGRLARAFLRVLGRHATGVMEGSLLADEMIMNVSFLLPIEKKGAFQGDLYRLGDEYEGKVDFKYEDGLPPYGFVNLNLRVRS